MPTWNSKLTNESARSCRHDADLACPAALAWRMHGDAYTFIGWNLITN